MKLAVALSLAGLGILCSGCALVQDARRNLCVSVCSPFEAHREQARNRRWAEAAWQQLACSEHFCKKSDDYARGFKDGYVEYVFRGGDGEPPLVAPLRYRHMRYQTADGYAAIEDWFAGYRHGAALARETGARRWVTGPSSLPGELLAQGPPDMPTFAPALPIYESRNGTPMTPPQFLPLPPMDDASPASGRTGFGVPESGGIEIMPLLGVESPSPISDKAKFTPFLTPPDGNFTITPPPQMREPTPPEPMRIRINGVRADPGPASGPISPLKAKITGVNGVPSPPQPDTTVQTAAPPRARITTITPAGAKE